MDDTCAVCADALEWVAYGSCGHRDVCSTCVARLRFICNDRRCCICKTESPVVFITKALGDYTVTISDFTVLPSEAREGRVGKYWYHEDTEAYFDDVDHYKMVKAMCRLSCSVCDGESSEGAGRKKERFRNIEQLKGHLFRRHKLFMCSLCLEGRKVFICEQKLYSRQQLNQHIRTGDSEVDGNESERGGFMGHPMCEFCKTPFYGDNELYSHMSTEHYTCHICQRQHPGQYEYFNNYDDLEIHFRRDHFLCEDEACLAKKFVVFPTEAEFKRHNTVEHGGRMSRSKRSAALQIPTSFRYRRSSEQDRRGRGRTFHRDQSDDQLSIAIQASLDSAQSEGTSHDPLPSSSERAVMDHGNFDDIDSLIHPFEALTSTDPEASSRYLQALGQSSRNSRLAESSFPPLQIGSSSSQQKVNHESESLPNNSMAARLRRQSNRKATARNSVHAWPAASHGQVPNSSTQNWPTLNTSAVPSRNSVGGSNPQNWPTPNAYAATSRSSAGGHALPSSASSTQALAQPTVTQGHLSSVSTSNLNNSRMSHSASAPNLSETGSLKPTSLDFPPISAIQARKAPTSSVLPKVEDVQSANRSLVEKMRAALEYDEDKYANFKDISGQYRQGSIDTQKYLQYVQQYGLSHLVLELARLCPDPQKQEELVEWHSAYLRGNVPKENRSAHDNIPVRAGNGSKKGKGIAAETSNSKDRLTDSFLSTIRTLQSNFKTEEEVEVLAKDGYRTYKSRSNGTADEQLVELRGRNGYVSAGDASHRNGKDGNGGSKQRKKTSKFNRVRLGDGSMASIYNLDNSSSDPDPNPEEERRRSDASEASVGLPVRGVWRKGGGQKLFS